MEQAARRRRFWSMRKVGLHPRFRSADRMSWPWHGARQLLASTGPAVSSAPAVARGSGEPAPEVVLPDLTGKTVSLKDFKGSSTMVLFWNPGCGFCRKMVDELKEWEANPPKGAPRLLVVSTGTVEANQALGLQSTTVLDEGFSVGRAFGASGTPSAVLVDAKGRLASAVSVGGPNVMAMARGEKPRLPHRLNRRPRHRRRANRRQKSVSRTWRGSHSPDGSGRQEDDAPLLEPGCGFCKRMVGDLNDWMGSRPAGSPDVVLVSTGTAEANRDMGINAKTLLDEGFSTGRKFVAGGTPSAILIDETGKSPPTSPSAPRRCSPLQVRLTSGDIDPRDSAINPRSVWPGVLRARITDVQPCDNHAACHPGSRVHRSISGSAGRPPLCHPELAKDLSSSVSP